jgi:hypothetical protein
MAFVLQDRPGSGQWKKGFETGVNIVRNRLVRAYGEGGIERVRSELAKPFDASQGRLER